MRYTVTVLDTLTYSSTSPYSPTSAWVYAFDARCKLLVLLVASVCAFGITSLVAILIYVVVPSLMLACAHVRVRRVFAPLAFLILPVLCLFTSVVTNASPMSALAESALIAARMVGLVLWSLAVCYTTSSEQLLLALRSVLAPLRPAHVPVDALACTLSFALGFVPRLFEECVSIKAALDARGGLLARGVYPRMRLWGNAFIALLVSMFRRADRFADSLDSRAFYAYDQRTYLSKLHACKSDVLATIALVALLVALVCVR